MVVIYQMHCKLVQTTLQVGGSYIHHSVDSPKHAIYVGRVYAC